MAEPLLEDVGEHVAKSGKCLDHADEVLHDACDGVFDQSRRTLKKGRRIFLRLTTNAQHAATTHLSPPMTGAFIVGIAAGFLVGWYLARRD